MYDRPVTEQDFRRPEFQNADPKDYEFRADGKIVRKDRWETAVRTLASRFGLDSRDGFEIEQVIDRAFPTYYVIAWGESDLPEVHHCTTREEVEEAITRCQFGHNIADFELLPQHIEQIAAQMRGFDDEDEWQHGVYQLDFEIGGIAIYKTR